MPAELNLVTELAIILIAAAVFTIISKALKQPSILGYIVAGFIVGPYLGLFPQFSTEEIHEWSELGIIFLLFGLGLEFSFKKLVKIGSSAFITSAVKCIGMFAVGYLAGGLMGWSTMECIFLGGMLGMSSTTIIIKAYDDLGMKNRPYSPLIFGSLVFEDLIAVLLLVLLSTIAATGKVSGQEMLSSIVKLLFFLILWFLVGIYAIPLLLRKARRFLNDEITLLVSIGLCFLMVVLANLAGFSSALGAFVMGSILAETVESKDIRRVTDNIKDLFGAIFFVSVGMMLDPSVVAKYWLTILIITAVTMIGILVFSTLGAILAGKGLDTAVHAGFSLAQLGEFAFIIAGLGCSLGVLRDDIYPVIIAVSVLTTFTTPYMIKLGDPVSLWLYRVLPQSILDRIDPPQNDSRGSSEAERSEWKRMLKQFLLRTVLYGVIIIGLLVATHSLFPSLSERLMPDLSDGLRKLICCAVTLALMMPFLIGMVNINSQTKELGRHLLAKNPHNRWPILAGILIRQAIIVILVASAISTYFPLTWWMILVLVVVAALFLFWARYSIRHFRMFESTFIANLNEKEEKERKSAPVSARINAVMGAYDVKLLPVTVSPDFQYAGKMLKEMPFRHAAGVNIIKIQRGSRSITIPSGNEIIMPGDRILAVGSREQLERFNSIMAEYSIPDPESAESGEFAVSRIELGRDSVLTGRSLRELDMRKQSCMIVSVMRGGRLITNPEADLRLQEGDTIWIAGDKAAVDWYN